MTLEIGLELIGLVPKSKILGLEQRKILGLKQVLLLMYQHSRTVENVKVPSTITRNGGQNRVVVKVSAS